MKSKVRIALLAELSESKESPELPKKISEQKLCVDLSLALGRQLFE